MIVFFLSRCLICDRWWMSSINTRFDVSCVFFLKMEMRKRYIQRFNKFVFRCLHIFASFNRSKSLMCYDFDYSNRIHNGLGTAKKNVSFALKPCQLCIIWYNSCIRPIKIGIYYCAKYFSYFHNRLESVLWVRVCCVSVFLCFIFEIRRENKKKKHFKWYAKWISL